MRCLIGSLWLASSAHAVTIATGQAQWCHMQASARQQTCDAWHPVVLPLAYQPEQITHHGSEHVIVRLSFSIDHIPDEPLGVYVPYMHHGARLRLNGALMAVMPDANGERKVRWERPLLWQITPTLLRQGGNELAFEMHTEGEPEVVRMARVEMGDWLALENKRSTRDFLVRGVPQQAVLMCGFMSMFLALIWLMRPRETLYGLLSGVLALWGLRTATFLVESLPQDAWLMWRSVYHWATAGFIVMLSWFACKFAQQSVQKWRWWALAWWFSGPLLLLLGGVALDAYLNRYWTLGLTVIGFFGVTRFIVALRRSRDMATWLLTGAVMVTFLSGMHDFLMANWPQALSWLGDGWVTQRLFLLHHAANLMLLCLAVIMTRRFVDTLRELGAMNRTLEAKIKARESALDLAYREKAELMVASATEEERQRIVLDMHDGLGSRLFTTLTKLERGATDAAEISRALRACIDDMRLLIDALAPGPQELSAAFANFRHRWDENMSALRIETRWRIADSVLNQAISPHQVMHILQVMQEALTNVVKHAGASHVDIAVQRAPCGETTFEVIDDGCGIPESAETRGRGRLSMHRRAQRLGGHLQVERVTQGTRVMLRIPGNINPT